MSDVVESHSIANYLSDVGRNNVFQFQRLD